LDLISLLLWEKKKLARKACLPQAGRQAAKGFFLWACLPQAGLCAFAPKKQITHTKALRAYLIPLHLSAAADRAFLLGQKKSS